jgi:hypothetical protein
VRLHLDLGELTQGGGDGRPQAPGRPSFGFTVNTDIGWYVNTQHEGHANLSLDFVQRDHASSPDVLRGERVAGTLSAFLVDDVDAEERRLRERPAWTSSSPSPPRAGANAASR